MSKGLTVVAVLIGLLAGCSGDAVPAEDYASSPAAEELDALAVETGALPDRVGTDPAGRYGRRYEGGSDAFCLVPDPKARGRYRFGAETRIGQDEYCRGSGQTRLTGDKLLLRFDGAGSNCVIVARYEGDKLVFPGSLDLSCASLCSNRGSFSGVSFPRIDGDVAKAREMRDAKRDRLCR